jgi:hypothetical protein
MRSLTKQAGDLAVSSKPSVPVIRVSLFCEKVSCEAAGRMSFRIQEIAAGRGLSLYSPPELSPRTTLILRFGGAST